MLFINYQPFMFLVELPSKPYVFQYIVFNYGSPANFSSNKYVNERFRKCLIRPSNRNFTCYNSYQLSKYTHTINISITQDDFYRYGWEISKSDIVSFGKLLEAQAKFLLCNMISFYMTFLNQKDAILLFQANFDFTEETWSYEAIKKVYDRFALLNVKISYTKDLTMKLENLLLTNLSNIVLNKLELTTLEVAILN